MENHINTCHIELYLINIWGTKGLQKHTKRLGHVILFKDTSINKILVIGILLIFVVGAFIPAVGVQVGSPARQSSEQTTPSVAVDAEESKGRATPTDSAILESKDLPSDSRPGPLDRDDPWWDTDWSYRKEITIDHTKVAASLVNFPVLISFASDADLASKAQDDGDDIVFINNATGTKLNHEIELFESTTGKLVAWVNVTSLSSTENTILYMYYGNPSCSNQENPESVWDSHYVMVQHLSETSGTHYDSTIFDNDGTPTVTTQGSAAGKIDGADVFNGASAGDDINISDSASLSTYTSGLTASAWIKLDVVAGGRRQGIFCKYTTAALGQSWLFEYQDGSYGKDLLFLYSTDGTNYKWAYAELNPVVGSWYLVTVVWSPNVIPKIYRNGTLLADDGNGGTIASIYDSTTPLLIGEIQYNAARNFDGVIDEARVSNIARSAGWINTSYNTMNSPATFLTVGNEQMQINNPPVFGASSPANSSTNNLLSLTWSIPINDPEGNTFTWTIQCNNGQTNTATGATNGTKSLVLSGLAYSTTYKVWVNATDPTGSGLYTRKWYTFTTKANLPPVFSTPSPVNGSTGNLLSLTWSIPINDPEGNTFTWTIQCNNGQVNSGSGAANGTKTLALSGLAYSTTYKVWVNATDPPTGSGLWTRRWYTFTTKQFNSPPVFGTPSPANSSTNNPLSLTWSIPINDPEGDSFNWTIQCSNGQSANANGASNGTKSLSLSGLAYLTTYKVWVNATDPPTGSGLWTRRWYTFTTKQLNNPPYAPSNPYPPNGSIDVSMNPDLGWTGGDPDSGDIITYDVYCGSTFPLPKISSNQTGTIHALDHLLYNTKYYWKVIAWDLQHAANVSPVWSFTTITDTIPPTVGITSPLRGFLYINFGDIIITKIPIFVTTLIVGKMEVAASATDYQSGISRVEFYLDGGLQATDTTAPYTWTWTARGYFFSYMLKVKAYDGCGNQNSVEIKVWKVF